MPRGFDGLLEYRFHPLNFWAAPLEEQGLIIARLIRAAHVERLDICARTRTVKVYVPNEMLKDPQDVQEALRSTLGD